MASDMVTITCTEEHAKVIQTAAELLMRLHFKQSNYIADVMMDWPTGIGKGDTATQIEKHNAIIATLDAAFKILDPYHDLPMPQEEKLAYEVWGELRHKFFMRDVPSPSGFSNAAYPPLNESGLKLPKVEFGSADVVRCADCKHCFSLKDTDPRAPYDGSNDGFYCEAWNMDMYEPEYKAEEFYCGDGRPPSDAEHLTTAQCKVYQCILRYWADHGYSPTYQEIATLTGYKGITYVYETVHKLRDLGLIESAPFARPRMIVPTCKIDD